MVKLVVLYAPPADPAAFDDYYFTTHVPLAEKIPGMARLEVSRLASPDGSPSPYYLQAELYFDTAEVMQAALGSPEGQAAAADVANFAADGATMLVAEVVSGGG